jgi:hypothetical protein
VYVPPLFHRYTFGGYAEASWGDDPVQGSGWAYEAAGDFLFRLGPGAAATYPSLKRTSPNHPTWSGGRPGYHFREQSTWPMWGFGTGVDPRGGSYGDLYFGDNSALGSHGRCAQGDTYTGVTNAVCGGDANWGATEMEVWYLVEPCISLQCMWAATGCSATFETIDPGIRQAWTLNTFTSQDMFNYCEYYLKGTADSGQRETCGGVPSGQCTLQDPLPRRL